MPRALADGDFINGQHPQSGGIRFSEFLFQKRFIDSFDRFGVEVQVGGNILDRHELTQIMNVLSQTMRHAFRGVSKTQLLNTHSVTFGTPDFSVSDFQPDLMARQVQIPQMTSIPLRMHRGRHRPAVMTERPIPLVRRQTNQGRTAGFVVDSLFFNFHSHKWKILGYTKSGHYVFPQETSSF